MAASKSLAAAVVAAVALLLLAPPASAGWSKGTATFYGGADGSGTMGGACGYGNLHSTGYGTSNAALSSAMFNNGISCGQCFQIACDYQSSPPNTCRQGASVIVTATNLCPPNYALAGNNGGWCNPPRAHFDMAQPSWLQIGIYEAGIIPVNYQRVPCSKQGGVRFTIAGKNYFELVLITNVGGSGSVQAVWVKTATTGQVAMSRNWGANWQCLAGLVGQALTFGVTTTGGQTLVFPNVAPANWGFSQSFITNIQFSY